MRTPLIFMGILAACNPKARDTASPAETGDTAPGPWDPAWPITMTVDGEALIEGSFDGVGPIWWVLDTGAARTYVDSSLSTAIQGDVVIGPVSLPDRQVGSTSLAEAEAYIGWDLGGLAGQDFFGTRVVAWDEVAGTAWFPSSLPTEPPPLAVGDPATLPFVLPSSIPVSSVRVRSRDGTTEVPLDVVADSGSGVTILTESIFSQVDDGTLPRLEGYTWATNYGKDAAFATRIPILEAGSDAVVTAEGTWAVVIPDDHHLRTILEAAGVHVEGFLGHPFWRRFVLGVDGPGDRYLLWPSSSGDPLLATEWVRVGFEPSWREGSVQVEMVFSPSDASEQGILPGDRVLSLDGVDTASLTLDDVKRALRGEPGERVTVGLERGEVDLRVEDLLPALDP